MSVWGRGPCLCDSRWGRLRGSQTTGYTEMAFASSSDPEPSGGSLLWRCWLLEQAAWTVPNVPWAGPLCEKAGLAGGRACTQLRGPCRSGWQAQTASLGISFSQRARLQI